MATFPTGWQTTGQSELDAIYRRFTGGLKGPSATQAIAGLGGFPLASIADPTTMARLNGVSGPTGSTGDIGTSSQEESHSMGVVRPPSQNAMQRHQAEAEEPDNMRGISPQRRFFWATGRVDARAPLSPRSAPTDFEATFGTNRQHMGGMPVTWQQRQQVNQQGVADARALRGLSPY